MFRLLAAKSAALLIAAEVVSDVCLIVAGEDDQCVFNQIAVPARIIDPGSAFPDCRDDGAAWIGVTSVRRSVSCDPAPSCVTDTDSSFHVEFLQFNDIGDFIQSEFQFRIDSKLL